MGGTVTLGVSNAYQFLEDDYSTTKANPNTNLTNFTKTEKLILVWHCSPSDACNKGSGAAVVKLQCAKDGGAFQDLGTADVAIGSIDPDPSGFSQGGSPSADKLSSNTPTGCTGAWESEATQCDTSNATGSFALAVEGWTTVEFSLDFSGCADGSAYTFRLYNNTAGSALTVGTGYGTPSVTTASAVQQTATPSDDLSTAWTEVFKLDLDTILSDNLSSAWTEDFEFDFGTTLSDNLSSAWTEVFILGSNVIFSDTLTFQGDVFYGGDDFAILAQDGDWIAAQDGETIEYQHAPAAQTATPSDDLSSAWTEVFEFDFGTTVEDNLSSAWAEVFVLGDSVVFSDTLTFQGDVFYGGDDYAILAQDGDWIATQDGETIEYQYAPAAQTATPSDNLSSAWTEVFEFDFGTTVEDDLSGDWTEVFEFDFGTTVEDDLSGDWTEVFEFDFGTSFSDNLSGDWDETLTFAFGTSIEESITLDEELVATGTGAEQVNESITLTEVLVANLDSLLTESITLTEVLVANLDSILAESITLTEVLVANLDSLLTESITLTEVLVANLDSILAESITLSEDHDFGFGTTVLESIVLDEELVTSGAETAEIYDTLTFSEYLDIGEIHRSAILTQDGDMLLAQDGDVILEQTEEVFLRAQDGDDIQTQAGEEILLQTSGAEQVDSLEFTELLVLLQTYIEDIDEQVTFGEILTTEAVTDDLIVSESIALNELLVTTILKRPVKSQAPELIIGADGTFLEAQYTESDTSHTYDAFTLFDQIAIVPSRYIAVADTITFTGLVSGVPAVSIQPSDSITLAEQLAADIGRLLTVNESITFADLLTFKFGIVDSLLFSDYISVANEYLYFSDGIYFGETIKTPMAEYTGAVFWFGEWIQLFCSLLSEIGETFTLTDTLTGTGQYGIIVDTLQAATEEDRVTPWTEENGTTVAEEHGSVDLYFTESLTYGTLTVAVAEDFRFVDDFYTQEYAMPCPDPTGPCTTAETGACTAPKTLGSITNYLQDAVVVNFPYYLSFTWDVPSPSPGGYARIFYRKKLTEEKFSTMLVDFDLGVATTPATIEDGDYEGGIRYETDTEYSAWTAFESDVEPPSDAVVLAETIALLRARSYARSDSLAFDDSITTV